MYMSSDVLNIFYSRCLLQCAVFKVQYKTDKKSVPFGNSVCVFPNGGNEIRTRDPLLARQVLSQLSYTPIKIWQPPIFPCNT